MLLQAAPAFPQDVMVAARVVRVVDGDTIIVDIDGWPDVVGRAIGVRVAGCDTPELRDKHETMGRKAREAKAAVEAILARAAVVELHGIERGKYFRLVADVRVGGVSLAETLTLRRRTQTLAARRFICFHSGKRGVVRRRGFAMESLFISLTPFLKVFAAFGLMLLCIRLRLGTGASILAGGAALGALCGMGPGLYFQTAWSALGQEKFHFLAVIIALILVLSDALERSGQSKRLMDALSGYLVSPRLRLVFFPALIGLLPMPGGAVFSAPMVKSVSDGMPIRNRDRALVNYWFRHVWEVCWPLYPGIILTVALADVTIMDLIGKTWPGTLVMLAAGWWFFLRPGVLGRSDLDVGPVPAKAGAAAVVREGLPLLVAIGGAVGLEGVIAAFFPGVPFEWGVTAALALGVLVVMIQNTDLGFGFLLSVMRKPGLWAMSLVVVAIFIFKDVMHAGGLVQAMADSAGGDAALLVSAALLPFLVGMVAGINIAFVGATFPLLLGVLAALDMQGQQIPYLILATFAGFTGVMVSPIHICFILTCQYFGCDLMAAWRKLLPPCLALFLCGVALFFFWS